MQVVALWFTDTLKRKKVVEHPDVEAGSTVAGKAAPHKSTAAADVEVGAAQGSAVRRTIQNGGTMGGVNAAVGVGSD